MKGSLQPQVKRPAHVGMFRQLVNSKTTPTARISQMRIGFPADVLTEIPDMLKLQKSDVFKVVGLPPSTASKFIREHKLLDQSTSERVDRLAEIFALASDTLGEGDAAADWLGATNFALGGERPIDLLDTALGAEQVRRVLGNIRYGGAL
ncbi:type II RES/Xre toxin-antitoxin system antitoxin [Chitinimonas sp. PSY-7]|uniref:type II RES/Xre toxin-antitoxin system antitoxin n=1 Tax=Chitinimonas sp. PSY-7 TaxID=3459088 RepID=UPI004040085E